MKHSGSDAQRSFRASSTISQDYHTYTLSDNSAFSPFSPLVTQASFCLSKFGAISSSGGKQTNTIATGHVSAILMMSTGTPYLPALTAEDLNGLNKCVFDWCDAIDHKDWKRLADNVAPTLTIDYRQLGLYYKPNITAREYLATINAPHFLGNPIVKTQHLVGASYFTLTAPDEAEGRHQVRAAHQIYTDESFTSVKLKGHGVSSVITWHKKVDGVWKLAGLRPDSMWTEHDFAGVMAMASPPENDQ